jgi:uncharacterized lipoprotein YbaY
MRRLNKTVLGIALAAACALAACSEHKDRDAASPNPTAVPATSGANTDHEASPRERSGY